MEIHFFGTSSGTPTKTRNVSGIGVVQTDGKSWCLVDCGEGTQHQLLKSRLSLRKLSSILITHIHGDHCYGLPGLLASAGMGGRIEPITIIAPKGIEQWIRATIENTALFLPYELTFIATETLPPTKLGNFTIAATELSHRVPSFAYSFSEHEIQTVLDSTKLKSLGIPKGPMWGSIKNGVGITYEGAFYPSDEFISHTEFTRKAIISGDNDTPERLSGFIENCNVLVHESTYTSDLALRAKEVGHSCASEVAKFAEAYKLPNIILTHFSPRYGDVDNTAPSVGTMRAEAKEIYNGNIFLAKDHEIYKIEKHGSVTLVNGETLSAD